MSLIEVLVAILVAALGIMSMLAMQINATKYTKTSEVRALGTLLIGDLADRMRANQQGFLANSYAFTDAYPSDGEVDASKIDAPTALCNTKTAACSAAEMAAADLYDWRIAVANALPGGFVRVSNADTANGENGADVWLVWQDPVGDTSFDNQATACPANLIAAPSAAADPTTKVKPSKTITPRCMHFRINI
jgi:type IV pilus assembly protein PilV